MARATEQEIREVLGGAGGLSSARIALVLETARRVVLRAGVAESHESFAELQTYYSAHLLDGSGGATGALVSKQIGDVSYSYARGQSVEGSAYKAIYNELLTQIVGLSGRIA